MSPFSEGAIVRLTQKTIKAFTQQRRNGKVVDWDKREGVVKNCNNYSVAVRWPGRKSDDWLPVKAIELVSTKIVYPLSTDWCLF